MSSLERYPWEFFPVTGNERHAIRLRWLEVVLRSGGRHRLVAEAKRPLMCIVDREGLMGVSACDGKIYQAFCLGDIVELRLEHWTAADAVEELRLTGEQHDAQTRR